MTAEEPDSIFQIIEYNNRAIQAMREQSAIDRLRHEELMRQGQGDTQLHEKNMQKLDAISERLFQSRSLQNTSKSGSAIQLSNYLFFTTNCQEALEFYTQCGLGDIKEMMLYTASTAPNESMLGKVRHSKFQGLGVLFYASDNHDAEPMRGSAQIIMTDDRPITDRLFTALAVGANVTTPLMTQNWGDYYGKLTDENCFRQGFDAHLTGFQPYMSCIQPKNRKRKIPTYLRTES
jgi:PhnB protein